MASIKDLSQDYQEAIIKGIDSLFSLQRQLIESTFELYEKSLTAREGGYGKTKKKVEDLSASLEKQLGVGQEKVKDTLNKFADKYLPDSKDTFVKIEKLVQENLDKVTDQMKKILSQNVDQNVQKTFNLEKELLNKIKAIYDKNITSYQNQVRKLLGSSSDAKSQPKVIDAKAKTAAKKVVSKKTVTSKQTGTKVSPKPASVAKKNAQSKKTAPQRPAASTSPVQDSAAQA